MSQFTTPFRGELVGKNKWKTIESFEYHIGEYPSNDVLEVPVGFITDFASVPRIFWPLISPIDNHGKAAVIHDYCYRYAIYPKNKCDLIFKDGLEILGVSKIKVFFMYNTVKYFGWFAWNQARRNQKKGEY